MTKDKYAMRIYIATLVFFVFFFAVFIFFLPEDIGQSRNRTKTIPMDTGWEVTAAGETTYYDRLPVSIKTDSSNTIQISRRIEEVSADNSAIGIFAFQKEVHAYINGREVVCFKNTSMAKSKMPGNSWLFIDLSSENVGKTLTLELHQCYGRGRVVIPVMYGGTVEGITNSYVKEKLALICFSAIGAAIGIVLVAFWFVVGKNLTIGSGLPWLGTFAFVRGIWSFLEANCYSFYVPHLLMWVWLSYVCLKMAVFPFAMFANITFHDGKSKFLRGIVWTSVIETVVTTLLQLFGVADYADTVIVTNVLIMALGIYVMVTGVQDLYKNVVLKVKTYDEQKQVTYVSHIIFMFVLVITSIIDIYRFYFTNSPDIALFSRVGYFGYVVAVTLGLLLDSARFVKLGRQAEKIKEEALIDPMTKLYNRAAFEKHIDAGNKYEGRGIIVFDLNNLKLFNDGLGHEMGDYYIKTSSELIRDVFGKYGSIYRIGGDEFCGIVEEIDYGEFERARTEMRGHIEALKIPGCNLKMGIAAGYCAYEAAKDMSLRDTMKRADVDMYNDKVLLKNGAEIR